MPHFLDMIRIMQQLERSMKGVYEFTDMNSQLLKAAHRAYQFGSFDSLLKNATVQFSALNDVLLQARTHMEMRDKLLGGAPEISALAFPAYDTASSICKMLNNIRAIEDFAKLTAKATPDWVEVFNASVIARQSALLPLETHAARLYELSAIAQASLFRVNSGMFGVRLGLDAVDQDTLLSRHDSFSAAYRSFYDDKVKDEVKIVETPKALTELPATEYVHQAALVVATSETEPDEEAAEAEHAVTHELATETSDQLISLLAAFNNDLIELLKGGRAVLANRTPDYVRHFATSYRELFTQLLHALSPDDDVKKWTNRPEHFHEKRPTRKARLLFITRGLDGSFGGFMQADIDAALEFLGIFQKGTHGVKPDFTEEEVVSMHRRMEGLLRFLLVINQTNK